MSPTRSLLVVSMCVAFALGSPSKYVKQVVRIESFTNCPKTQYPVQLNNTQIGQVNRTTFAVNSQLNVPKSILPVPMPMGRFTLKKCSSRADKNACEHYMRFDVDDICEKLMQNGQAWSGLVKPMVPTLVCPIEKDSYVQVNGMMDAEIVGKVTPEGFIWSYELEIFHKNKLVFCHAGAYEIQRVKELDDMLVRM